MDQEKPKQAVAIALKEAEAIPDRSIHYSEIGVTVRVFSRKYCSLQGGKVYFINPDVKVGELVRRVREDSNVLSPDYKIHFYSLRLEEDKRLAELGFVSGDEFWFGPNGVVRSEPHPRLAHYLDFVLHRDSPVPPKDKLFKVSHNTFQLSPSLPHLLRMDFYELGAVKNFKVQNEHGRITFLDPVDIRGMDLSAIVVLEPSLVELYPEGTVKPIPGQGLNVPAEIHFFGMKSKKGKSPKQFEQKLRAWVERLPNSRWGSYDKDRGELCVRISHF